MNQSRTSISFRLTGIVLAFLLTAFTPSSFTLAQTATAKQPESLSAAEFSRLSQTMSEDGGYFRSDNFTSNETAYLTVLDKLKQLGASGGDVCHPDLVDEHPVDRDEEGLGTDDD